MRMKCDFCCRRPAHQGARFGSAAVVTAVTHTTSVASLVIVKVQFTRGVTVELCGNGKTINATQRLSLAARHAECEHWCSDLSHDCARSFQCFPV